MIQRIQTLYIAAVVILQILALQFSYLTFDLNGEPYILNSIGRCTVDEKICGGHSLYNLLIPGLFAIIISGISIVLFKKRNLQIKLIKLFLVIAFTEIGFVVYKIYTFLQMDYTKIIPSISFYFIMTSVVFAFLAIRAINKDENLIKSVDRIR